MVEDERREDREDEAQEGQPSEKAGAPEESAPEGDAEAPQGEAEQAAEAEVRTAESEREAEEAMAAAEPDEAPAEPAEAEAEPAEAEQDAEPAEGEPQPPQAEERPKQAAKDVPPGAELEPISIEPERELSAEERARLEAEAEERARAEAEATAEAGEEPAPAREPAVELESDARIQATGKRKTSIARVVLRSGTGEFEINKRRLEEYFPRHQHQTFVRQPLLTSGYEGKVDVRVRVHGGGISGQAGAVRHGIARALTEIDPELRGDLKKRGLLTRDARAKERRKAGLKKARKRPQFSKR
jgi:small subunit ribosomal protein S9